MYSCVQSITADRDTDTNSRVQKWIMPVSELDWIGPNSSLKDNLRIKIQSLSTHPHADGETGEVS